MKSHRSMTNYMVTFIDQNNVHHLIFKTTTRGGYDQYSHFADEEKMD